MNKMNTKCGCCKKLYENSQQCKECSERFSKDSLFLDIQAKEYKKDIIHSLTKNKLILVELSKMFLDTDNKIFYIILCYRDDKTYITYEFNKSTKLYYGHYDIRNKNTAFREFYARNIRFLENFHGKII